MAAGVTIACVLAVLVVRQRRRSGQGTVDFPPDETGDDSAYSTGQLQWNNDDIFWVTRTKSGLDDVDVVPAACVLSDFEEMPSNEAGSLPSVAITRPSSIDGWSTLKVESKQDDVADDVYGDGVDDDDRDDEDDENMHASAATIQFLTDVHAGSASNC